MKQSAYQQVVEESGRLLIDDINNRSTPGDKMGSVIAVSFNNIVSTAAMLMGSAFDPQQGTFPSMDHVLLAQFVIYSSCSINSGAEVHMEFSPFRVWEALEDFKRFTGRDGERLIDPILMAAVKKTVTVDPSKFGPNAKFLQ